MKRQDIHRPSAIIAEDYTFVAFDFLKIESLGDCYVLKVERERKAEHMAQTGGKYSQHEHGGNCYICGSVNAIYTCTFYHEKTNTYIRVGQDCAQKLDMSSGDFNAFRAAIHDAIAAKAGKKKAQAILDAEGLGAAWAIYVADYASLPGQVTTNKFPDPGDPNPLATVKDVYREEITVRDMVGKLVKYGSMSGRALNYLGVLLNKIENRAAVQAKRDAEKAAAAPCPTGRIIVSGLVLKAEIRDGLYGPTLKMTVKHDTGWIVWGTAPRALDKVERGDRVSFTATVKPSENDTKFGMYKRPTGGTFLSRNADTVSAEPVTTEPVTTEPVTTEPVAEAPANRESAVCNELATLVETAF